MNEADDDDAAPERGVVSAHGHRFDALVDDAPDAIARLSRRGAFLYVNRMLASQSGRTAAQLVGKSITRLGLPLEVTFQYRRGVRHAFVHGTGIGFDYSAPVSGVVKHFAVRIVPEFDGAGAVESALVVTYDVTQRTETERQRDVLFEREQAARSKAEAASHARDQFLAIVSHELRSPLNGIQSWSHVLENQLTGPDRANVVAMRALEGIRAGIAQQVGLIEHLLDATVAMTGDLHLTKGPFVLRDAIDAAVTAIRSAAIAKDVAVHVDMRLVDERIDGDPRRIRQVFDHLLSNALKFTPNGGSIWLSARSERIGASARSEGSVASARSEGSVASARSEDYVAHAQSEGVTGSARREGAVASVVVRDSGRGLAAGFEQWLFEPFRQADSSNTRRSGGIGLGLALARRLALLHGGAITAESAGPHLGATFTVTLPLEAPASVPIPAATTPDSGIASGELAGVTVLVIDDQLEAREALSALLVQFGARVYVAASSRAGLETIGRMAALPDIVVCDVAMPEEDGYGFVRRLRHHEATASLPGRSPAAHTPVVALSAFTDRDRPRDAETHFDVYLAKPVSPHLLLATLSRLALGR